MEAGFFFFLIHLLSQWHPGLPITITGIILQSPRKKQLQYCYLLKVPTGTSYSTIKRMPYHCTMQNSTLFKQIKYKYHRNPLFLFFLDLIFYITFIFILIVNYQIDPIFFRKSEILGPPKVWCPSTQK